MINKKDGSKILEQINRTIESITNDYNAALVYTISDLERLERSGQDAIQLKHDELNPTIQHLKKSALALWSSVDSLEDFYKEKTSKKRLRRRFKKKRSKNG